MYVQNTERLWRFFSTDSVVTGQIKFNLKEKETQVIKASYTMITYV